MYILYFVTAFVIMYKQNKGIVSGVVHAVICKECKELSICITRYCKHSINKHCRHKCFKTVVYSLSKTHKPFGMYLLTVTANYGYKISVLPVPFTYSPSEDCSLSFYL